MERLASSDNLVCPVTRDTPVEATVCAAESGLSGLVLRFGTYQRRNASTVELRITRVASCESKSTTVDASTLRDNAFVTFRFAPFANHPGEMFAVLFASAAGPDACVAVFVTPAGTLETRLLYGEFSVEGIRIVPRPDAIVQAIDTRVDGERSALGCRLTHWWVDRFGGSTWTVW